MKDQQEKLLRQKNTELRKELAANKRALKIEAALEKVRSRSSAMYHSDELNDVIDTIYEQMKVLGINMDSVIINIFKAGKRSFDMWSAPTDKKYSKAINIEVIEFGPSKVLLDEWENGNDFVTGTWTMEEKNKWFQLAFEQAPMNHFSEERKRDILQSKLWTISAAIGKLSAIQLNSYSREAFSPAENEVLRRFSGVFEQAFIRFLDLQKAEMQVNETNIEAALERVRYRAMAMQNSDDVGSAAAAIFDEISLLHIETMRCGICIFQKNNMADVWAATSTEQGNRMKGVGSINMAAHPLWAGMAAPWQEKKENYVYHLKGEDLKSYYRILASQPNYQASYAVTDDLPDHYFYASFFEEGAIFTFSVALHDDEKKKILRKFTSVFGLTFRRFLDLKKAETQAREANIEASLERVRSRTMAMRDSQDIGNTIVTMFDELMKLGVKTDRYEILIGDESHFMETWTAATDAQGLATLRKGKLDMSSHPLLTGAYHAWKSKEKSYTYSLGDDVSDYYKVVNDANYYPVRFDLTHLPGKQFHAAFFFSDGALFAFTPEPLSEDAVKICKRFAGVFALAYRRFLDLQKAEAQSREALIETALERVRSRAMAMHNSADLSSAVSTVFTELRKLGIDPLRCGIGLLSKENRKSTLYASTSTHEIDNLSLIGWVMLENHPVFNNQYEHWMRGEDYFPVLQNEVLKDYYAQLSANFKVPELHSFEEQYGYFMMFTNGFLFCWSQHPYSEADTRILKRFSSVIDLTYKRYFDLQKAETQARDATIESALEKVRGRAMAMHSSNDLSSTASLVFTELRKLGISPIRCGVGVFENESRQAQLYAAASTSQGDSLALVGGVLLSGNPVMEKVYDAWTHGEDYYPELQGEELKSYYQMMLTGFAVSGPDSETGEKQYGHFIPYSIGTLFAWSDRHYDESEIKILKRFGTIIDLTFRRYMELQKTEAGAREAVKQAALDRVRADIASMRTTKDLDRITPLIWNELTVLGIPFVRCGVFIMDETQQLIHTFLSTPDGKAIGAFHLPYHTAGFTGAVNNWQQKKMYITQWGEKDFISLADTLVEQGAIAEREQYLSTLPKEVIHLHFLPFLQGMLYVGNTKGLGGDEIHLLQAVADAFSTAYARYEDFNLLESAKKQVEKTLLDLKQAQTQLVQSEKMASLGELTAGIAHEIQNPLNFVNNFSEVSNELIEELLEEWQKEKEARNEKVQNEILNDIKTNLEKINHHGKRADAIVKGMLQHSRSSTGQKEPTDINALIDEYLRLCFHGIRAKDKSFNASIKTDYDESIEKINIIPQDMGRVILNLLTNAFYTVHERNMTSVTGYEPAVFVRTKKLQEKIEVTVRDNGNGITQKVVDKIFQPFFTTKPTGQGTGLGLSLSYDIVKAHGGEIKVETKEGEGTSFIIILPTTIN